MTDKTLDFANVAAASKFIAGVLVAYNAVASDLHIAACVAIHQAAAFGRCENLGKLYDGLRKNDQVALRIWLGKQSAYMVTADNVETKKHWLALDTKAKTFETRWSVKKGTDGHRAVSKAFNPAAIVAEQPFHVKENNKKDDPFTMVDLLASVKAFIKRTKTRADNEDLAIPADLMAEFTKLEAIASTMPTATKAA